LVGEPFNDFETSVQDFFAVFKVYRDKSLVEATKRFATTMEPLGAGRQIKGRLPVAIEHWKVQDLERF
jgi:hypothetical protein